MESNLSNSELNIQFNVNIMLEIKLKNNLERKLNSTVIDLLTPYIFWDLNELSKDLRNYTARELRSMIKL